jgi:UDP-GlcNAc:undecaprenyl-phosphate/decaprenyl-phosphate GlcNAc-1-phosphate transferase
LLNILSIYTSPFVAFFVSVLGIRLLLNSRLARIALDNPNHRSLHKQPIPRSGGVVLMVAVLTGWSRTSVSAWLVAITIGLLVLSFWDDIRGLRVRWRLLGHFLAASVLLLMLPNAHGLFWFVLMLPAMVWAINLYNFMDGADGLAGGMALIGFTVYGFAAALCVDSGFASINFTVATAAAAFLLFNFHPAKIFMGDAGAIPLGFLAAAFGVIGWDRGLWQWWFPLLVFSPFVVDASVTLLKRLIRGDKVWLAHREHYYQRLVQMGWGHGKVALIEYSLMTGVGFSSVWGLSQAPDTQLFLCMGWLFAYLGAMQWVDRHWNLFVLQKETR